MLVDHLHGYGEQLHVEVDDSFEGEFFGSEKVKEHVETVAFVELGYFSCEFVCHGEGGGSVGEPHHHVSEVVLHLQHFLLKIFICFLQLVLLLLASRQFANQHLHLPL